MVNNNTVFRIQLNLFGDGPERKVLNFFRKKAIAFVLFDEGLGELMFLLDLINTLFEAIDEYFVSNGVIFSNLDV